MSYYYGTVAEDLESPREIFEGLAVEASWTNLQLVYFAATSMWTYLTPPFTYALPGFEITEIEPWRENAGEWRRLRVAWPEKPVGHSKVQTLYVGEDRLLSQFDYELEIAGGARGAHYPPDYSTAAGITLPKSHTIVGRDDQDVSMLEPVLVSIELDHIAFAEQQRGRPRGPEAKMKWPDRAMPEAGCRGSAVLPCR